ncbi:Uncharacterised protein [Yersinia kristensenii]|uniref:Uncharacterized protein n=1 Tax=Yersinia kristensenii TaxID=28152 RepID=A0A0T9LVH3_YERKR|nr:Uncharacterised protein [Yersinia kristensenii]CNL68735.1 Uncharacterised protein [Yersinia kristensenii]
MIKTIVLGDALVERLYVASLPLSSAIPVQTTLCSNFVSVTISEYRKTISEYRKNISKNRKIPTTYPAKLYTALTTGKESTGLITLSKSLNIRE